MPKMEIAINLVFATFFISVGEALHRSSSDQQQTLQDLDTFIQTLMTCESRPVVGLTVSVVKDGQTIFAKGYGQRDLQTGQAVDNTTLFGVGSISKSFTSALLAAILGEREDVSWDTVLTDILGPDFRFRDQFRTKETTLRDILAHKTGLESLGLVVDTGLDIDRAELTRRIRYFRQAFPFRTRWHYNNFMYTLAGHVAEKLAGKPYETLLRERLLQPLGMRDTVYLADVVEEGGLNFAQTYWIHNQTGPFVPYNPENRRPVRLHLPAGGVVSNALDMARYMNLHLSGGMDAAGRLVVPEDTLRQTHTADFIMPVHRERVGPEWPVGADMLHGYGLGWMSGYYRGHRRIYHSGLVTGFTSLLSLFPAVRGGVFTSVNGVRGQSKDVHNVIHHQISDILIGKDHWLNTTTACSYPQPWWTRPTANDPVMPETSDEFPRDKRDYEGVYAYGNRAAGTLTISLNATDGKLYFRLGLIGHGVLMATDHLNVLKASFEGPLTGSTILVDVIVKNGLVFSLSFRSKPPDPDLLFERNLKLTDPDTTNPKWDGCSNTSGAIHTVLSSRGISIVFILILVMFL